MQTSAPVLFVLLWSTGFLGAKFGLPYIEPANFLTIRFGIVAILFAVILLLFRIPLPKTPATWLHLSVSGVLVHGIYLGGVFAAIALGVNAGVSALIVGVQPLVTAVLVGPLLGEQVTPRQWKGFLTGLAGVFLVVLESFQFTGNDLLGLVLCIAGLAGISVGTVYQKRFCTDIDLRVGSTIQFAAAMVFVGVFAFTIETREVQWHGDLIFAMGWLCIVLSLGAVTVLMWLIRHGAASKVASLFYLVPPLVAVESWLLFGETMSLFAMAGMLLCAIGVWLVLRQPADSD